MGISRIWFPLAFMVFLVFRANALEGLPNPEPWRHAKRDGVTLPAILKTESILTEGVRQTLPYFQAGDRSVHIGHDGEQKGTRFANRITVMVDRQPVITLYWWGSLPNGSHGYPFRDMEELPPGLVIDRKTETVVYTKWYLDERNERAFFTYTLAKEKNGKLALTWNSGNNAADFGFILHQRRGARIRFGSEFFAETPSPASVRESGTTVVSGLFDYAINDPVRRFTLDLGDITGEATETYESIPGEETAHHSFWFQQSNSGRAANRVILDLGASPALADNAPPPTAGMDFWRDDAMHVPVSPVRNLFPNPSFEQGLRYWTWMRGGGVHDPDAGVRYAVVPEGRFGRNALLITRSQPHSAGLASFPIALENNETYTLSFWTRAVDTPHSFMLAICSAGQDGKYPWPREPDQAVPEFHATTEWRRHSRTFTADEAGIFLAIVSYGDTLIDGIQLEEGATATDFVAPPVEGLFDTIRKYNDIATGEPLGAFFRLTGKPQTRFSLTVTVTNAFRERVYEKRFHGVVAREGTVDIPLALDSETLGQGVFVVRSMFLVDGFPEYSDYHRFSIMSPLDNTHPTKNLFGTRHAYSSIDRGEELAAKYRDWGFGSTSWGYEPETARGAVQALLEKRYGITNFGHNYVQKVAVQRDDPGYFDEVGCWTGVSPDMEREIEEQAFRFAQRVDPQADALWSFGNEEEHGFLVRNGLFDQHFKANAALERGVRRAIPDAVIMPTQGTSGYSRNRGYDAMEGYLSAAFHNGYRYGAVAVHPYGNLDGGTIGGHDLDRETQRLIEQIARWGHDPRTPIHFTECFNITDTSIQPWQKNEWGDDYQAGRPTYDFGNQEFLQAAGASRLWLIALKYWPQLKSANIWVERPFLDLAFAPLLLCKAANTLGQLFADARHLATVNLSEQTRCHVFQRDDGAAIAAVWTTARDVERGFRYGPLLRVAFSQPVTFRDFMGNLRRSETGAPGDRTLSMPLTPAPLFILAENPEQLILDLRNGSLHPQE